RSSSGTTGKRLLDVGAAGGIFLDLARSEGYEIEGIEPSQFLADDAEKRYDIKLFRGTVEQYQAKKKFSVITLLDIIEHLVEPDDFMNHVDRLIEDNGILVLVTPDVSSLAAKLTGKKWWHYRIAHINFFNIRSIRHLLEKHGYKILMKKKYVWNFSLYYLLSRVFPFLKEKKSLQKGLKRLHLKLPLFDSWEIYAKKEKS
ncbi:MAG: class I SAM-dependent methyltransferase, partial [bacterium]|nr:class I SAM-dependent methyltransferase [bacterium]